MKRILPALMVLLAMVFVSCPGTPPGRMVSPGREPVQPEDTGAQDTLIECVYKVTADLAADLPQGAILGVIKISSADPGEGEFAEEQLIFCLVQTGKFRIVERRELDVIRGEQNFQLSGDVDDETAVSIGRMAGAGMVITGSILSYGGGKYLTARALDVESSQIRAVSSRPFAHVTHGGDNHV